VSQDPFSNPSEGGVKITDYEGKLLLITPTEYKTEVPTSFGEKDCVVANVAVLDGDDVEELDDVYIFQGRLIGQTKAKVGKGMVLGRLGKKAPEKAGHSPAWTLEDPTEDDKVAARAYLKTKEPFS
jgi:hypothetical protein